MKCMQYIEMRGWPVSRMSGTSKTALKNPLMIPPIIETLVMNRREEEAIKLVIELAQKLPPQVLASESLGIIKALPQEYKFKAAKTITEKLPPEEMARKAGDIIGGMPDKEAKLEVARLVVEKLPREMLVVALGQVMGALPDRKAKLLVLNGSVAGKLSEEDMKYVAWMLRVSNIV
ncbi:MAG: hypothetical protein QXF77_07125 [Candidatus Jordarchaeales archaeon]